MLPAQLERGSDAEVMRSAQAYLTWPSIFSAVPRPSPKPRSSCNFLSRVESVLGSVTGRRRVKGNSRQCSLLLGCSRTSWPHLALKFAKLIAKYMQICRGVVLQRSE
jgi:hypothetical protein